MSRRNVVEVNDRVAVILASLVVGARYYPVELYLWWARRSKEERTAGRSKEALDANRENLPRVPHKDDHEVRAPRKRVLRGRADGRTTFLEEQRRRSRKILVRSGNDGKRHGTYSGKRHDAATQGG